jgi:hypothetical protein
VATAALLLYSCADSASTAHNEGSGGASSKGGTNAGGATGGTGSGGTSSSGGASSGGTSGGTSSSGGVSSGGAGSGGTSSAGGTSRNGGASSGGTTGTGGTSGSGGTLNTNVMDMPVSANIVVDQFGYRPAAEKFAVLRKPVIGFDAPSTFAPGSQYAVVDAVSGQTVITGAPSAWNSGATDGSDLSALPTGTSGSIDWTKYQSASGDKTWWFTFTQLNTPGTYVVVDQTAKIRSAVFTVGDTVYRDVLKAAIRMLYYQRSGIAKEAKYAGDGWTDTASFPQDKTCPAYNDATVKKDLSGGWWDAGDYNKYTNWHARYLIQLLQSYNENPAAFFDDYNIPESGNGIPDIIDEVTWGMDWLIKMQNDDGSVLSIVGYDKTYTGAKLPSAYTAACAYGTASTSASLSGAAAFAYGAIVYKALGTSLNKPELTTYASDLQSRAVKAFTWATANPAVTFRNTDHNLGGGEQEVDSSHLPGLKLLAAAYLFDATGDSTYKTFFEANYNASMYFSGSQLGSYVGPWDNYYYDGALTYATLAGATSTVAQDIKTGYAKGMTTYSDNLPAYKSNKDGYGAYMNQYTWGSNQIKSNQGLIFSALVTFGVDSTLNNDATTAAERFVHYFHGVNPLQLVMLTNMGNVGAEKSVNSIWHTWFGAGTDWSQVGVSKYGPPPGYLIGGPTYQYNWDSCCPSSCGSTASNALCVQLSPPMNQPPEKSYKDINDDWPMDTWSISEPDNGYQIAYIRLLSKYVK